MNQFPQAPENTGSILSSTALKKFFENGIPSAVGYNAKDFLML
jgi:hypothetical protein